MTPVIDVHAHFLPEEAQRVAGTDEPWHGLLVEKTSDARMAAPRPPASPNDENRTFRRIEPYFRSPAERIAELDAAGVDTQIVSLTPSLYRYDMAVKESIPFAREVNDELQDWTSRFPGKYLGFATLPLQDVDASISELDRAVNDLGLVGFMVDTHVNGSDWDSPHLLPVLEAAEALDAIVFVHPGTPRVAELLNRHHLRNFIGNPFETTVTVACLIFGGVLDKVPAIKMVFAHGGGFACADAGRFDHGYRARRDTQAGVSRLPSEYLKELYFDSLTHSEPALRYILDVAGPGQVVLGTDYPADMGPQKPHEWIDSCTSISDEEKVAILGGNISDLLATSPRLPA